MRGKTYTHIIGLDEVGWGAILGPIGVGCVVFPKEYDNPHKLKDSKKYSSEKRRKKAADIVKRDADAYCIELIDLETIMKFGAGKALRYAMQKIAYQMLTLFPKAIVVIDGKCGLNGISDKKQVSIVRADSLVPAVSAASVIAKVFRDEEICSLSSQYPEFDLKSNKGYPTPQHLEALKIYGPTKHHRLHTKVVKEAFKNSEYTYEEKKLRED